MALPAGKSHPKTHHAQAVNLDIGEHVDAHGVTHKTSKANPVIVGGHTMVFAHRFGHPPMPFAQHAMHKTNVYKHMTRHQTHPHPRDVQAKMLPLLKKTGGMMPMGMGMAMAQPLAGGGPQLPAGGPMMGA